MNGTGRAERDFSCGGGFGEARHGGVWTDVDGHWRRKSANRTEDLRVIRAQRQIASRWIGPVPIRLGYVKYSIWRGQKRKWWNRGHK